MSGEERDQEELAAELERLRQRVVELEAEQRRSQVMFRSLVESVPDVIYQLDRYGNIVFINNAIKKYGYDPEELIGKSIFDLIHPEDRKKATYKVNERRTRERRTRSLEIRLLSKGRDPVTFEFKGREGEEPTLAVSAEGIYHSEQPTSEGFVCTQGVARDITDRVRAEKAIREAEQVKVFTETAAAAAHEINQPLTVVLGTAQLLLSHKDETDPDRPNLENIVKATERIREIVEKMQKAHRYATKPYAGDQEMVDFDAASEQK